MSFQMSLDDFQNHLENVSYELLLEYELSLNKTVIYKIELDLEKDKKHNSMDDFIYRAGLENSISKKETFSAGDITKLLCRPNNLKYPELFPLWIKVSYLYQTDTFIVLHLLTSTRFRKHSLLKNREWGYPPFEIIRKNTRMNMAHYERV